MSNSQDFPEKNLLEFFFIILYVCNLVSDIAVMSSYFSNGHMLFFALTLILVLSPTIITNLGTIAKLDGKSLISGSDIFRSLKWIFRFFSLGQLWMLIEAQIYNYQSKYCAQTIPDKSGKEEIKKKFVKTMKEMRLWTTLTESIPQLYLQLYIMINCALVIRPDNIIIELHPDIVLNNHNQSITQLLNHSLQQSFWHKQFSTEVDYQVCSIFTSFLSIASALTSYAYSYKTYKLQKHIPFLDFTFFILWQMCWIATSIFSLSLFASALTLWFFMPIANRIGMQRLFEYGRSKKALCKFTTISFFDTSFLTIKYCKGRIRKTHQNNDVKLEHCNGVTKESERERNNQKEEEIIVAATEKDKNVNDSVASGYLFGPGNPFGTSTEPQESTPAPPRSPRSPTSEAHYSKALTNNQDDIALSSTFVVACFAYCALESSCLVALWCWVVDKSVWFYWWCVAIHVSLLVFQFIFMCLCICRYKKKKCVDREIHLTTIANGI